MYAERYAGPGRFSPGGLVAAVGINAVVIAALMFAAPNLIPKLPDKPFEGTLIDLAPPPPPDPVELPKTENRTAPRPRPVDAPKPLVPTEADTTGIVTPVDPGPLPAGDSFATGPGTGTGTGVVVDPPAPSPPMVVGPAPDPRFARDFQPPYPPSEQRLGNVGRVTVRVLVGPDGRVQRIERVSATSDAFFRATEQHALRRWRFKPGTSDGVPQMAWRTMTVTFVIED